ncbi:unnamed protein product [Ectocarpus sp. 8 AP-2014]
MKPSASLLALASVATCLLEGAHGFVAPINNLAAGGVTSGTHDVCSSAAIYGRSSSSSHRHLLHRSSRRLRHESTSLMMMAAAGKKRKRRKVRKGTNPPTPPASPAAAIPPKKPAANSGAGAGAGGGVGELGDVLEGDRKVEALFSDDWSGMPANTGMTKSNVPLPDISEFKPSRRAESTLEQREKKSAVGLVVGPGDGNDDDDDDDAVPASRLAGFESKLTPIVDREEEWRKKNAAERFEEGPIVRGLKTATWFSICTLVLWEVYINSPWFHAPESPPPML